MKPKCCALAELKQSMLQPILHRRIDEQMNTKNKTQTANDLIAELCNKYGNGNFIYKGEQQKFLAATLQEVNASLY